MTETARYYTEPTPLPPVLARLAADDGRSVSAGDYGLQIVAATLEVLLLGREVRLERRATEGEHRIFGGETVGCVGTVDHIELKGTHFLDEGPRWIELVTSDGSVSGHTRWILHGQAPAGLASIGHPEVVHLSDWTISVTVRGPA